MKLFINLICILTIVTTSFAVDEWLNFSSPFPIKAAAPYGDGLLLATGGGVRYRTNTADDLYTTSNGLGDQSISGIAVSNRGIFAVSDYGLISALLENGTWQMLSRSYVGSNVHVIPGMVRLSGSVMVIAFEDRLSFFSLNSLTSILTIDRIANASLVVSPISVMDIHGDSLYVVVDNSLYVRKMDWENLENDVQLNNPDSWNVVKKVSNQGEIKSIAWKNDKLQIFSKVGTWLWDKDGESHAFIDTFSVFSSSAPYVMVRGKSIKDSILYERDSIVKIEKDKTVAERYYFKSKVQWLALLPSGKAILAGPQNVFYYDGKKVSDVTAYERFAIGGAYELQALPVGGVVAASEEGKISYSDGNIWTEPEQALFGLGNHTDARGHNMKVLSSNPDGKMFYHVWGVGFALYSDWGKRMEKVFWANEDNCMGSYLDYTPYTIAVATTSAPDGSGFLTTSASNKGYSLVYVDRNGNMSCADFVGSAALGGPMFARIDENTGNWIVYVGTREAPSTDAAGGLDVFTFPPPKTIGGDISRVDTSSRKTYSGAQSTPLDLTYEPKTGYVWMVTNSSLVYWTEDQDTLRNPLSTNGLTGSGFSSIDVDSRGNLWVGTTTQGAFRLTPRETNPDTLSVLHFTTRQGLLSDRVQDVAVDTKLGMVWFAHEYGISRYKRNDLRGTEGNMTDDAHEDVKVYPIPFRPGLQPYVVFDNVSDDAVINVYNKGGKLVVSLRGDEIAGGRAEWDGRMKNGKFVAPGVYQYVIRGASNAKKGKLIIIH